MKSVFPSLAVAATAWIGAAVFDPVTANGGEAEPGSLAPPPTPTSSVPSPTLTPSQVDADVPTSGIRRTYPGLRTIPGTNGLSHTGLRSGNQPVGATNVSGSVFGTNAQPGSGSQAPGMVSGSSNVEPSAVLQALAHSSVTPAQWENINRLEQNLDALGFGTRDRVDQQVGLFQTLQSAPIALARPTPELIASFGSNLVSIVSSLGLTAQQRRQLAIDINLALNSGNLTPAQSQRVLDNARTLLQPNMGSNPAGVGELVGDLAGLIAQVQANNTQLRPGVSAAGRAVTPVAPAGQGGASQTEQGSGGQAAPPDNSR